MGGGILPVAYHENDIYFLFSRESFTKKHKGLWSDFGGSKENRETQYETAIRECVEESCGILGNKDDIRILIKNNCITKIRDKGYSIYLVRVEYNKKIVKIFSEHFKKMLKDYPDLVKEKNGLFEKDKLRWIKLQDLKKNIHIFRPWYKKFIYKIIKYFN